MVSTDQATSSTSSISLTNDATTTTGISDPTPPTTPSIPTDFDQVVLDIVDQRHSNRPIEHFSELLSKHFGPLEDDEKAAFCFNATRTKLVDKIQAAINGMLLYQNFVVEQTVSKKKTDAEEETRKRKSACDEDSTAPKTKRCRKKSKVQVVADMYEIKSLLSATKEDMVLCYEGFRLGNLRAAIIEVKKSASAVASYSINSCIRQVISRLMQQMMPHKCSTRYTPCQHPRPGLTSLKLSMINQIQTGILKSIIVRDDAAELGFDLTRTVDDTSWLQIINKELEEVLADSPMRRKTKSKTSFTLVQDSDYLALLDVDINARNNGWYRDPVPGVIVDSENDD